MYYATEKKKSTQYKIYLKQFDQWFYWITFKSLNMKPFATYNEYTNRV